jgi:hypothetical protein
MQHAPQLAFIIDDLKSLQCSRVLDNRENRDKHVEKCFKEKQEEKRRRPYTPKLSSDEECARGKVLIRKNTNGLNSGLRDVI